MDGITALDITMSRLGGRTSPSLRSIVLAEMQMVQTELLDRLAFKPWFLLSEDSTVSCVVGEQRLPLPLDFLQESEEGALWYTFNGIPKYPERRDWDVLAKGFADGLGNGPPEYYALGGKYYFLFPAPDIAYTFHLRYYQAPEPPTDTTATNAWLTHVPKLLIAATVQAVAAGHLQNFDLATAAGTEVVAVAKQLELATEERLHTSREYFFGGKP